MGVNDRYTAEEDQRLTEHINNRLWAARIPEEDWDTIRVAVFASRNTGFGAPVDALIKALKSYRGWFAS